MRKLSDINSNELLLDWIRGRDSYAGMLEGTPYLARKFRLMSARNKMKSLGIVVLGLEELEREIDTLGSQTDVWAPNEEWTARLISQTDWISKTRRCLVLMWFQSGGDPMQRLATEVCKLDFNEISQVEAVDDDD